MSEAQRHSFASLCAGTLPAVFDALAAARDSADAVLVDVGCGCGTGVHTAATQGWRVLALDPDPDMTTTAHASTRDLTSSSAVVVRAGLPDLPLAKDVVNAVVANFVINHVADPRRAVREVARVLRPGGLVAMTIWTPGGAGWTDLVDEAFRAAGAPEHHGGRLPAALDFERSAAGLARLAREAGLNVATQRLLTWTWRVRPHDLWACIEDGLAGPGARYLAQSAPTRRAVRVAYDAQARAGQRDGLLEFACTAAFVVARAPR